MFSFTLFVVLFTCANAAILPETRIVGGTLADINDAPWQVAILSKASSGVYNHVCGGVIITETSILTAAQCTNGIPATSFRTRSGSTYHNSGGQVIAVNSKKEHESFDPNTFQNDLAFLYLENKITLGISAATAILPSQGLVVPDGSYCFVTGWGTMNVGGTKPSELYKVTVPSVNQALCASAYAGFLDVTSTMLCAGDMVSGGLDACQGDAGGPLTIINILIGITSWGQDCGSANHPGVYTRVPMYRNWIDSNL